ncbi:MAG: hypothetical protein AB7G15_05260 [Alphaproteobacteria bacterium]
MFRAGGAAQDRGRQEALPDQRVRLACALGHDDRHGGVRRDQRRQIVKRLRPGRHRLGHAIARVVLAVRLAVRRVGPQLDDERRAIRRDESECLVVCWHRGGRSYGGDWLRLDRRSGFRHWRGARCELRRIAQAQAVDRLRLGFAVVDPFDVGPERNEVAADGAGGEVRPFAGRGVDLEAARLAVVPRRVADHVLGALHLPARRQHLRHAATVTQQAAGDVVERVVGALRRLLAVRCGCVVGHQYPPTRETLKFVRFEFVLISIWASLVRAFNTIKRPVRDA